MTSCQSKPSVAAANDAKSQGFRMPAEWEAHEKSWMMWPSRENLWPDMAATKKSYVAVAKTISQFEAVTMVVNKEDESEARMALGSGIDLLVCDINDSWARDAGPNFLLNEQGELAGAALKFNAWGESYSPYDADAKLARTLLEVTGAKTFVSELVGEGGGLTVDGEGTIITTESCFLHTNRNPGWTKEDVSSELCRLLGGEKVIWLPGNDDEVETLSLIHI